MIGYQHEKKLVIIAFLLSILLLITACSFTELIVKEESVMEEYVEDITEMTEDSFSNDKEVLLKVDEVDTSQEKEMNTQPTDSEENEITTEAKGEKVECDATASEKTNTSKPNENINKNPATNTNSTISNPTISNPTTNNSSNTGSGSENEELPDNTWEDVSLEPQTSREAFALINAERIKLGLEPAVWDAECERIALTRGEEIAPYAIPEHDGFLKFQNENRKLCECLAWGYLTAEDAVDGWMNSSAHKEILMDPEYVKLAVVRIGNKWVAVNSR